MIRLRAMLSTTAVRLSALYLGLFALCAIVLVFYVTAISEGMQRDRTQTAIASELRIVAGAYRGGGVAGLVRVIERRSRQPGANLYAIAVPTGELIAGNIAALQPGVLDAEGWSAEPFHYQRIGESANENHRALAQVVFLPNGMRLMVGRDIGEREQVRGLVRQALVMALAIMFAGALAIWFFVGRRALKRIDHMSAASEKILAGDLSQRLPVNGSGDEFDRLSLSLNTMLGRIERLNEGLRQVSDNIAHDLKTPLTRLRNRAEAALAADGGPESHQQALEQMIADSDQLIRTFNALLMISRVEAGSSTAQMSDVDLSGLAQDAVELYEPVAEEQGVKLTARIAPGISIRGNRELLSQALSNLIDNAIKYAGDGPDPEIIITLARQAGELRLAVADNGRGIPAARREDVVQRFVRLDESRSKPGTGLGLSLVQAVAALHGGRLTLDDAVSEAGDNPGLAAIMVLPGGS
ncbi:HAMP domain-containing sensor histidine kinase [Hoeflea sp. YIM 152468]|uniref:sensor histidine kinase n=1 Tax=Hoeflea sp. YIM 152468 TaxID=3031759 RepID=UPI0023D9EDB9|nr:HAMP domain-containing sensor histidine kinase [Hoeflea sp. YIM 152468]MDF1607258.1 HAMP domain-containing sensor histidine kinase [Hoeflea sp. YIM 152468]